jgi:hypothetical protein
VKNKVWIILSLVVLLISSKDISSQDLNDKVVVHTPIGKVTIIDDNPLEACAEMIQGSFREELVGVGEPPIFEAQAHCFKPRPGCRVCCWSDGRCKTPKKPKCCQPNPCPPGPQN